ncbi:MAG: type IV pilus twitching motility protein PilT [Vulcanimicrobiaceae bacterium]
MNSVCAESMLRDLLRLARMRGASDVHFSGVAGPYFRIDNELQRVDAFDASLVSLAIQNWLGTRAFFAEKFAMVGDCTTMLSPDIAASARVHVWREGSTQGVAIRLHDVELRPLDEIGLPAACSGFLSEPHGLLLFTGPTGSGKSTSLFSAVRELSNRRPLHILTIEDPIEVAFSSERSFIRRREVGRDAPDMASCIRSAMRSDPDVLVIGEMRDVASITAALEAAETGHLVVSTLHASSSVSCIQRIVDSFPADRSAEARARLSGVLVGIVNQRLLPRIGGGRVVAAECLVANDAVRTLIREARSHQIGNVIATGRSQGMESLSSSIERLRLGGVLSIPDQAA